jgi:hypothetical protein
MIGLKIVTTRTGILWPTEYWKCLIDALFMKGSNADPRTRYPDLVNLNELVQERSGRFFPVGALISSTCDDTQLRFIQVERATGQFGYVAICESPVLPDTDSWFNIDVPYFGTIGDRRSEQQIQDNRIALQQCWPPEWQLGDHFSIEFRLSASRLDRDLDNLADGIMPFFSSMPIKLCSLRLYKSTNARSEHESLHIS